MQYPKINKINQLDYLLNKYYDILEIKSMKFLDFY